MKLNRLPKYSASQWACIVIFILVGVAVVIWRLTCGWWCDDWVYNQNIGDVTNMPYLQAADSFWSKKHPDMQYPWEAFGSMYNHWWCNNGRTIHIFTFLSYLVPQWVVMTVNGLMVMAMMWIILRVCGFRYRSPLLLSLFVMSIFLVLPWQDHLAASVFCMNYVWVTFFMLWVVDVYSRWTYSAPPSWGKVVGFSVLTLLIGSMHEGMAAAVLCGMTSVLIISLIKRRGRVPFKFWLPGLTFAVGMAVSLSSRATMALLTEREAYVIVTPSHAIYMLTMQLWPVWVALLTLVLTNLRKGWHGVARAFVVNMIWIVAGLVAAIIAMKQTGTGRYYWMMYICALVVFWKSLFATSLQVRFCGWKSLIAAVPVTALLLFWLGTLAWWQNQYTREQLHVRDLIAQSMKDGKPSTNIFYADLMHVGTAPWWLMYSYESLDNFDCIERQNLYTSFSHDSRPMGILPTKYRNLPPDSLPVIPGTAGLRGEYTTLYGPKDLSKANVWITLGEGWAYQPIGSVNLIYTMGRRFRGGKSVEGSIWLEDIKHPVAPGDTLYYYHLQGIGRSLFSLPILRIDTVH